MQKARASGPSCSSGVAKSGTRFAPVLTDDRRLVRSAFVLEVRVQSSAAQTLRVRVPQWRRVSSSVGGDLADLDAVESGWSGHVLLDPLAGLLRRIF